MERRLGLLIELQELDSVISQLMRVKEAIPHEIRAVEQIYLEEESHLEAMKVELDDLHKKRRSKERELESQSQEMKKRQGRLLEVKTNKEYSAILHEIEALKQKQTTLEDEILNILETADQRSQQVSAKKEKLAHSRELGDQKRKTWGQKLVETEARLAHLLQERVEKISGLDRGLLQAYTRIFENRQGLVVVPVKNGSCSGCFVTLTPQSYQEARKNDRIIFCSSCNRILYWKE